jgi:hypothetical protein
VVSRRSRSFVLQLTAAAMVATACGGGHGAATKDRAQATGPGAAPRPGTPPPTFKADHIRSALLPPHDVAAGAKLVAPTFPGLTEASVPGCSASAFRLPGRPKTLARQLRAIAKRGGFTGTAYIQLVALYPDATAAANAMEAVRGKVKACPAKRHFPAERREKRQIALSHTDTWTITEDTTAGWRHVRGFEKHAEPPSSGQFSVFYDVYDYAVRGNVVIATLYWERVKPATSGQKIADRATAVLTKQLQKIG